MSARPRFLACTSPSQARTCRNNRRGLGASAVRPGLRSARRITKQASSEAWDLRVYTGCETDRRVLRAATLEYRRVLFHRLCNGTRRPLELAAALLACGFLLAFCLRWLRTFFSICMRSAYLLFRSAIASGSASPTATLHRLHCHCNAFVDAALRRWMHAALLECRCGSKCTTNTPS